MNEIMTHKDNGKEVADYEKTGRYVSVDYTDGTCDGFDIDGFNYYFGG